MRRLSLVLLALAPAALLQACSAQVEQAAAADFAPVIPEAAPAGLPAMPTGGIYSAAAMGLFATDTRAAQVGDILTVDFTERFAASKSQSAGASGSSEQSIDLPGLPGGSIAAALLSAGGDQEFSGRGQASQSNSLIGTLSVQVVRVHPGGLLEIMGQKRLVLNQGDEWVRLTGLVRQEDIGADNVIPSDRIANADIRYVAAGAIADTAAPGWLMQGLVAVAPL